MIDRHRLLLIIRTLEEIRETAWQAPVGVPVTEETAYLANKLHLIGDSVSMIVDELEHLLNV